MPIADIDSVPAESLKQVLIILAWLATTGAAIFGGRVWGSRGRASDPVHVKQPIDVRAHDDAARKSELVRLEATIDGLAEQMNAQFAAMGKAGQDRAAAIAQSIDEEVGVLSQTIGELAEALHEKINRSLIADAKQSAEIASLQAGEFRHNSEIARIQEHISDLLARPSSSRKS